MPRNLRTEAGRLPVGLAGEMVLLAASLVRPGRVWTSGEGASSKGFSGGGESLSGESLWGESLWGGESGDLGVGCDESGPRPGVGGRGVSGGLSRGAGIEVPSVREKLMGVSVNGLYENLLDDMAK